MMKRMMKGVGVFAIVLGIAGAAYSIPPVVQVPEINPGLVASALTLLTGGTLILLSRRVQK